jgi:hypothetical protein
MTLDDRVRHIIDQYALDEQLDPGLSPCLVREALIDRLDNDTSLTPAERSMIDYALAGSVDGVKDDVSVRPEITWLCTRFVPLPDCSHSPWEELRLQRSLILLRGGVQQAVWIGYRNFFSRMGT